MNTYKYIYRKAQAIRKTQYQRFSDGSDDDDKDKFGGHRYRYRRRWCSSSEQQLLFSKEIGFIAITNPPKKQKIEGRLRQHIRRDLENQRHPHSRCQDQMLGNGIYVSASIASLVGFNGLLHVRGRSLDWQRKYWWIVKLVSNIFSENIFIYIYGNSDASLVSSLIRVSSSKSWKS
jgi:hypothetical protein